MVLRDRMAATQLASTIGQGLSFQTDPIEIPGTPKGETNSCSRPVRVTMIEFYFDDSGTHDNGAPVVVWGGIVGKAENFEYLGAKWREFLAEPSPGRTAIQTFSLSKCKARKGDFERYDPSAVSAARKRSRQVIIESGVSPVAYGIEKEAWHYLAGRKSVNDAGSSARIAFGLCAKAVLRDAEGRGEKVKMIFDLGQSANVYGIAAEAAELFPEIGKLVEFSPIGVASSTGLQAADTIAHEFYDYAKRWIADRGAKPGPELAEIIEGAEDARMYMMGEPEISAMLDTITCASQ